MKLFPAIDLYDGQVVRLYQGDYQQMTVYGQDPLAVARSFREAGAEYLHLVDLAGAKSGGTPNLPIVKRLAAESGLAIEVGGGVRSEAVVRDYLAAGVARVIIGTAAVTQPGFAAELIEKPKKADKPGKHPLLSGKKKPATTESPASFLARIHPGSTVTHRSFGKGTVLSIQGDSVWVDFPGHGKRRLSISTGLRLGLIR